VAQHFALGSAVHQFLAAYFTARMQSADEQECIEAAQAYVEERVHTYGLDSLSYAGFADFTSRIKSVFPSAEVVAVEEEYVIPVDGLDAAHCPTTRADLVLRGYDPDTLIVVDHKTTSNPSRSRAGYWSQYTALRVAVAAKYGIPVENVKVVEHLITFASGTFVVSASLEFFFEPWMLASRVSHINHFAQLYTFYSGLDPIPTVHNGPSTPWCFGCPFFNGCHGGTPVDDTSLSDLLSDTPSFA
jgi:hypothetical protein